MKIKNRFKKLQRNRNVQDTATSLNKRGRPKGKKANYWNEVPEEEELKK